MSSFDAIDETITAPRLAARFIRSLVPQPCFGSLKVIMPAGQRIELRGPLAGPEAVLVVKRWRALWKLLRGGEIGFAEAFIEGDWTTPDLTQLLEWALRNEKASGVYRGHVGARLMRRLAHGLRANTKRGSRRNIAAHYDLGNDFYKLWLDPSMSYSSAVYANPDETLEQAQQRKLDRIVALLDNPDDKGVLEIGFGWGGVLERLAGNHNCRMTGLTLSTEQLSFSGARLGKLDLSADLRLQDYRDVEGKFDRIVSIEMLEAVGEKYWPVYFRKLRACLKPGGTCVLQVITIDEARFADYRAHPDFIQAYVFPGGMLPTKTAVRESAIAAGFTLGAEEAFGQSYALTLREWRKRFLDKASDVSALGLDSRFRRMWEYYLAYCEAGFLCGSVDVSLIQLKG
ncbi:MAG TPA: cyclopropane-fatty-acyl-phospholipid synthase family protein [Pseudolabrys sp.]|nr:cyclopropane-fatty-acyl-phospholipid synthase family protein [Pseudolabrys sp.]